MFRTRILKIGELKFRNTNRCFSFVNVSDEMVENDSLTKL